MFGSEVFDAFEICDRAGNFEDPNNSPLTQRLLKALQIDGPFRNGVPESEQLASHAEVPHPPRDIVGFSFVPNCPYLQASSRMKTSIALGLPWAMGVRLIHSHATSF